MIIRERRLVSIKWRVISDWSEPSSTVIDTSLLTCVDYPVVERIDINSIRLNINLHFVLPFGLNKYTIDHWGYFNKEKIEYDVEKFKKWYTEEINKMIISAWDGYTQFVDFSDTDSFFKKFLKETNETISVS